MEESEELLEEEYEEEDTQRGKYMTFQLGKEIYGIEISYVNEIIGMQKITEVPETEDYMIGLINLRGKIIPVIDVRIRFQQKPLPYNDRTCIIVINVNSDTVGLIVDSIKEVTAICEEEIIPPPKTGSDVKVNRFVYGITQTGNEVKLLLNPEILIYDKESAACPQDAGFRQQIGN